MGRTVATVVTMTLGDPMRFLRKMALSQRGQTTAEYALVLMVAALVVGGFATFVRSGAMTEMFSNIVSSLVERAHG